MTFDLSREKVEEIMVRSDNDQFKALLAGIIIGAAVGIAVYIIGRYLGMSSSLEAGRR